MCRSNLYYYALCKQRKPQVVVNLSEHASSLKTLSWDSVLVWGEQALCTFGLIASLTISRNCRDIFYILFLCSVVLKFLRNNAFHLPSNNDLVICSCRESDFH